MTQATRNDSLPTIVTHLSYVVIDVDKLQGTEKSASIVAEKGKFDNFNHCVLLYHF